MRARRGIVVLAFALAHSHFTGQAAAQAPRMHAGLAHMLTSFQLRVVAGRITVAGASSFQTHKIEFKTTERHERLELTQAGTSTSFHYELTTPQAQLTWDLLAGNEVSVRRLPRSDSTDKLVVFSQPTQGPLTLAVGEGGERKELRGNTLWHLFLGEPQLCDAELAPLLQVMKPDWNLAQTAQTLENMLFRASDAARLPMRDGWRQLVADLGHEKFSRRQAADRRLRLAGAGALPFLLSLDQARLDAEQRFRVTSILRSFAVKGEGEGKEGDDAPEQIVRMLLHDPDVWLDLLDRDELEKRRIAAEQLSRLLNDQVDSEGTADPAKRREQIETIRRRLKL